MFGGALIGFVLGSIFRQGFLGGLLGAWLGYASKQYGSKQWQHIVRVLVWSLFGFIAGSAIGLGVLGLLLGFYVGHTLRVTHTKSGFTFNGFADHQQSTSHEAFIDITFHTIGYLAKLGGSVKDSDIAFAKRYMSELGYSTSQKDSAMRAFRQGREQLRTPLEVLQRHQLWLLTAIRSKQTLIEIIFRYEQSYGRFNTKQQAAVNQFYYFLGVTRKRTQHSYRSGYKSYSQPNSFSGSEAYRVLGLQSSASIDEIKKSYRKMMAQYHPDRVMSKGLSEDEIERYTEKAKKVQQAYAALKELKGF